MTADPARLDRILLEGSPLVPVPRYSALPELEQNSHRYLVAETGLHLEVRRPWLHVRWPVHQPLDYTLPYGAVEPITEYSFSDEDVELIRQMFLVDAVKALPNECAAVAIWNERDRRLEYRRLLEIAASPGEVRAHMPRLEDHEHLAIDLHSHGHLPAMFSGQDDDDDRGAVKVAMVVGTLDGEITSAIRLCALGLFIDPEDQEEDI